MIDEKEKELVKIEISDMIGDEAMMEIDTQSTKDFFLVNALFVLIVAATTLSSCFGSNRFYSESKLHRNPSRIQQAISGISPANQQIFFTITFECEDSLGKDILPVTMTNKVIFRKGLREIRRKTSQVKIDALFKDGSAESQPIIFLRDKLIDYDNVLINIDFEQNSFKSANLRWWVTNTDHTRIEIWIRFVFMVSALTSGVLFYFRTRSQSLTFEQSITLGMIVVACIGSNPFFILQLFIPSTIQQIISTIFYRIFQSFVYFAVLAILGNTSIKDSKRGLFFYFSKIDISLIVLIAGLLNDLCGNDLKTIGQPLGTYHKVDIELITEIIYDIYFLFTAMLSLTKIDAAESNKTYSYILFFSIFVVSRLMGIFLHKIPSFFESSADFAFNISLLYAFVIVTTYFHWPYESSIDQQYTNEFEEKEEPQFLDDDDFDKEQKYAMSIEE